MRAHRMKDDVCSRGKWTNGVSVSLSVCVCVYEFKWHFQAISMPLNPHNVDTESERSTVDSNNGHKYEVI